MDRLDPARTALVVVHMVKGVAGDADTPFSRLFHQRAEQAGLAASACLTRTTCRNRQRLLRRSSRDPVSPVEVFYG